MDLISAVGRTLAPARGGGRPGTARSPTYPDPSIVACRPAPPVAAALEAIGRTEDIQFSPDNRRLAICGFIENRVLILDVDRFDGESRAQLRFPRHVELVCTAFDRPHGLVWIDGETLVVANRNGEVVVVGAPPARPEATTVSVEPMATIRADAIDGLRSPGSVAATDLGDGRFEILVCNNSGNTVTSHLLRTAGGCAIDSSSILLARDLAIPDSISVDPRADWIAVSNHLDHSVFLYENSGSLCPTSPPAGVLRGVLYPHGLRFAADGRRLFVADAGLPFIHVYSAGQGDWRGDRYPETSLRVMDDATFLRGRDNPQEGGPKGLDLTADGAILVATCDEVAFVCFDVRSLNGAEAHRGRTVLAGPPRATMRHDEARERHRRLAAGVSEPLAAE